jgi:hypothetical protein
MAQMNMKNRTKINGTGVHMLARGIRADVVMEFLDALRAFGAIGFGRINKAAAPKVLELNRKSLIGLAALRSLIPATGKLDGLAADVALHECTVMLVKFRRMQRQAYELATPIPA